MTERVNAILDAAENRIRRAGYNGFSFREIASDVGIKSASVHYHFPTKADLATAVAKRYRERFEEAVAKNEAAGAGRVETWKTLFRDSLAEDNRMCLCGILAAEKEGVPEVVADEARQFFEMGVSSIAEVSKDNAENSLAYGLNILATLEGAMLLAQSMGDNTLFDLATTNLK